MATMEEKIQAARDAQRLVIQELISDQRYGYREMEFEAMTDLRSNPKLVAKIGNMKPEALALLRSNLTARLQLHPDLKLVVSEATITLEDQTDPEPYQGEPETGLEPEAPHSNEPGQDERVPEEKDIQGTDPSDPPVEPEVKPHVDQMLGILNTGMEFIDDVPKPTREEGSSPERPVEDLDNKDPHDPDSATVVIDIDDFRNSPERETMRMHIQTLMCSLDRVDQLCCNARHNYLNTEGFGDTIVNALVGVGNVIGHVVNLFKTGLFNGWRTFKRGELTAYSDSNRISMSRMYNGEYHLVSDLMVNTPQGMKGNYITAIKALDECLQELNMVERSSKMLASMNELLKDLRKQNPAFASHVGIANREFTTSAVKKSFDATSKIFTGDRSEGGRFSALFGSMQDFEYCVKQAMDFDTYLRSVAGVVDRLDSLENTINCIIAEGSDPVTPKITRAQAEDLSKVVRAMAEQFDMFAVTTRDCVRVQHNLTFVCKAVRQALHV